MAKGNIFEIRWFGSRHVEELSAVVGRLMTPHVLFDGVDNKIHTMAASAILTAGATTGRAWKPLEKWWVAKKIRGGVLPGMLQMHGRELEAARGGVNATEHYSMGPEISLHIGIRLPYADYAESGIGKNPKRAIYQYTPPQERDVAQMVKRNLMPWSV